MRSILPPSASPRRAYWMDTRRDRMTEIHFHQFVNHLNGKQMSHARVKRPEH